jgi:hypothetical protein
MGSAEDVLSCCDFCRILDRSLMHDQFKPHGLTRRNNDFLRLTTDAHYRIAAGGHVEHGVAKIIG